MPIAAVLNQAQVRWWGSSIVLVSVSDSGSGVENIAILNTLNITDAGTGAESLNLTINAFISDAGAGNETVQLLVQIPISELASGVDAVDLLNQLSLSDTGSANDVLAVLKQIAIADTGSGAEAITLENIILTILDKGDFTLKQFQRYFTVQQITANRYILKFNNASATVKQPFETNYTLKSDDKNKDIKL